MGRVTNSLGVLNGQGYWFRLDSSQGTLSLYPPVRFLYFSVFFLCLVFFYTSCGQEESKEETSSNSSNNESTTDNQTTTSENTTTTSTYTFEGTYRNGDIEFEETKNSSTTKKKYGENDK